MIVMCAWCQREGRPATLGEKEPLDTVAVSHGICDEHALFILVESRRSRERVRVLHSAAPPGHGIVPSSQAAPMQGQGRFLLIVSRATLGRSTYPEHKFGDDTVVEVIVDRRVGQRRQHRAMTTIERRSADRRRQDVNKDMQDYGWTLVKRS
jgi:hypothetical protein